MFNPAKRVYIHSASGESSRDLRRVVASLEASVQNAKEFILLSGRYPLLARQPYNTYLILNNCMFGRQMEMERIINFLLQDARNPGAENLGDLPIVGPANVAKSILTDYACIDERMHNHFSRIVLLGGGDLIGKDMEYLADGASMIKHENRVVSGGGRVLIIVEIDRDISEDFCQKLFRTWQ
jgi:hypothetical protein